MNRVAQYISYVESAEGFPPLGMIVTNFEIILSNLDKYLTSFSLTTFDNGSLGSRNDEERSELRYVV
jgi:hypothetical protein